jgi:hypothetical protein
VEAGKQRRSGMLVDDPVWVCRDQARMGRYGSTLGQRALVIAARGPLGSGRVPDYNVYDRALYINIGARL